MTYWTRKRSISFMVHAAFVSVPFVLSTVSALLFWQAMFDSWWLAVPMVAVIDVLALAGLVLYIARIPSPFVVLRHLLPFISIVPLGRELYLLLEHNEPVVTWSLTLLTTAILVVIAWQCFRTIEALFIDPVTAARERAREQVERFSIELARLHEVEQVVDTFARERVTYLSATAPTLALSDGSSRERVAALAAAEGVSERTIWRRLRADKAKAVSTMSADEEA